MKHETRYDILNEYGDRMYSNMAYDSLCDIYYNPDDENEYISGWTIEEHFMEVIEAGNFVEWDDDIL